MSAVTTANVSTHMPFSLKSNKTYPMTMISAPLTAFILLLFLPNRLVLTSALALFHIQSLLNKVFLCQLTLS